LPKRLHSADAGNLRTGLTAMVRTVHITRSAGITLVQLCSSERRTNPLRSHPFPVIGGVAALRFIQHSQEGKKTTVAVDFIMYVLFCSCFFILITQKEKRLHFCIITIFCPVCSSIDKIMFNLRKIEFASCIAN
uniref:Uncharacterized protein n=1 Tax=Anopheles atroparvus TaxID=41427 RepID=A0A182JHV4_ANOAO